MSCPELLKIEKIFKIIPMPKHGKSFSSNYECFNLEAFCLAFIFHCVANIKTFNVAQRKSISEAFLCLLIGASIS